MILTLTLILLPLTWLAAAALAVAACRAAKQADRVAARQRGRREGGPTAVPLPVAYGFAISQGV